MHSTDVISFILGVKNMDSQGNYQQSPKEFYINIAYLWEFQKVTEECDPPINVNSSKKQFLFSIQYVNRRVSPAILQVNLVLRYVVASKNCH